MRCVKIDSHKIRAAMIGRYRTFGELAKAAGLSPSTLTSATTTYHWHSRTLDAIADALDVNPLTLLTVEEENTPIVRKLLVK